MKAAVDEAYPFTRMEFTGKSVHEGTFQSDCPNWVRHLLYDTNRLRNLKDILMAYNNCTYYMESDNLSKHPVWRKIDPLLVNDLLIRPMLERQAKCKEEAGTDDVTIQIWNEELEKKDMKNVAKGDPITVKLDPTMTLATFKSYLLY